MLMLLQKAERLRSVDEADLQPEDLEVDPGEDHPMSLEFLSTKKAT
jgi:hypothetical protein